VRWLSVWGQTEFVGDGADRHPVRMIGASRDITAQKRAEEALRESEARLQGLIDGSPGLVFVKDTDYRFVTINKCLETLLGMTRDEIKGKTDYDIFPPDIADCYRKHDRRILESGTPEQVEEIASLLDGRHVFLSYKFPLYSTDGQPYAIAAISTDITKRKQVEDEHNALLRQVAHRAAELDATLNAIADGLLIYDRTGQVVRTNAAAEEILCYQQTEHGLTFPERISALQLTKPDGTLFSSAETPMMRALNGEA
jgi:PAS domain S-box-containing protein